LADWTVDWTNEWHAGACLGQDGDQLDPKKRLYHGVQWPRDAAAADWAG